MNDILKIYQLQLVAFSAIWLILPRFSAILIALMVLTTIIGAVKRKLHFNPNLTIYTMIILYGIYVISLFVFGGWESGPKLLEYKLSFLIFPLILSFSTRDNMMCYKRLETKVLSIIEHQFIYYCPS